MVGRWAKKSSWGAGSTAICTASSNRSYSASLIAPSQLRERKVAKIFCFRIEAIAQIASISAIAAGLVTDVLIPAAGA
jgi:hypothetical protein